MNQFNMDIVPRMHAFRWEFYMLDSDEFKPIKDRMHNWQIGIDLWTRLH